MSLILKVKGIAFFVFATGAFVSCSNHDQNDYGVENYKAQKGYKTASYRIRGTYYKPMSVEKALTFKEEGMASWYGRSSKRTRTASGETMNSATCMTAAHKTLPIPSVVRVTSLKNGKTVDVRINDRGPFVRGRIIDLSPRAAGVLGLTQSGVQRVKLEVLSVGDGQYKRLAK